MREIMDSTIIGFSLLLLSFFIGLTFEAGRNMATKTKKVCDTCFRDINQVNELYKRLHKEESNEK